MPSPSNHRPPADARSKWAPELGLASAMGATARAIPPLLHVPPPVVSRVLFGGEGVAGERSHARGEEATGLGGL
jgi:hypothetical protein